MAAKAGEALGQYDAGISSVLAYAAVDLNLTRITRGIFVGVAGNVQVQFVGDPDTNQPIMALAIGMWHPMQIQKIIAAGTTATGVLVGF